MEARRGMNRGTQTVMLMLAMVASMAVLLVWEISPFTHNSNHVVVLDAAPIHSLAGDLEGIHVDNENKTKASEGPERGFSSAELGAERATTPDEQSFTDLSHQENTTDNIVNETETLNPKPDDRSTAENTDEFKVIELFENSNDIAESPKTTTVAGVEKAMSENPSKLNSNSTVQLDERNTTVNTVTRQGSGNVDTNMDNINDQLGGSRKSGGNVTQQSVEENVSGFKVAKDNSSAVEGGEEDDVELANAISPGTSIHEAQENLAMENLVTENLATDILAMENQATENLATENLATENQATENLGTENLVTENLATDNVAPENLATENLDTENVATENLAPDNLGLVMEDEEAGLTAVVEKGAHEKNAEKEKKVCDYTVGKWVLDKTHPLYSGRECTMWLSPDWACRLHNHPDKQMDRYRWQPAGCDLPVFNASATLESLRNKVLAFVGDSLGRQQWQSLLCMLTRGKSSTAISDTASTFNFHTPRGARRPTGWATRFEATNTTIIFKWSVTLAKVETRNNSTNALHLDRPEQFLSNHLHNLDVVILNSGHHWNNDKIEQNGYKFYTKGKPVSNTSVPVAYNQTIHNVVNWIHEKTRNSSKVVFYRSLSPRHFRNGDWNTGGTCDSIRFEEGKPAQERSAVDAIAESAVKGTSVKLLNITALSMERGETHVSKYGRVKGGQDCLHWCLPGVPDTWNEILLANIAARNATYETTTTTTRS